MSAFIKKGGELFEKQPSSRAISQRRGKRRSVWNGSEFSKAFEIVFSLLKMKWNVNLLKFGRAVTKHPMCYLIYEANRRHSKKNSGDLRNQKSMGPQLPWGEHAIGEGMWRSGVIGYTKRETWPIWKTSTAKAPQHPPPSKKNKKKTHLPNWVSN